VVSAHHNILSKNRQTIPHLQDYILSSNVKECLLPEVTLEIFLPF
jgi:hypothetical protein